MLCFALYLVFPADKFETGLMKELFDPKGSILGLNLAPPLLPPLSLYLMSGRGRGIPELFLASSIRTQPPRSTVSTTTLLTFLHGVFSNLSSN